MKFIFKLNFYQLLILSCLIINTLQFKPNLQSRLQKPKRKLLEKFAQNIVDYFDLESYLIAEESINKVEQKAQLINENEYYEGCNSIQDVKDYFFDVYSSFSGVNMSSTDLEHLIEYLVTKYPKNELIEQKTQLYKCERRKCFQSRDISRFLNSSFIDYNSFSEICPMLLFNFEIGYCEYDHGKKGLSGSQKWGFGLLLSGIVTFWSWNGAIVLPIINKKIYKRMLTFMISLAFGCLTSNSLLKYIPLADGFEITYLDDTNHSYFYKHLTVLTVVFFFFMFERSMKILTIYKTQKYNEEKKRLQHNASVQSGLSTIPSSTSLVRQVSVPDSIQEEDETNVIDFEKKQDSIEKIANKKNMNKYKKKIDKRALKKKMSIDIAEINIIGVQNLNEVTDKLADQMKAAEELENLESSDPNFRSNKSNRICCTSLTEGLSNVKPVGWMAIFGDGLGNFIDGLSIGASINQNFLLGITTALAVWFGNIPQELGDFALLVRAGMSPFQALFYNYCSGNLAYLGCIIGIVFGSDIEAARWIFSISGAATMYLGLAVLLPEMNEEFEDGNEPLTEKLKITFIQVFGIITGFSVMIILNMYEDDISF